MREGESGHQKYNQIMRYVTLAICIIQGVMFASAMSNPRRIGLSAGDIPVVINPGFWVVISTVITLTAGTRHRQRRLPDHHGQHHRASAACFGQLVQAGLRRRGDG